MRLGIVWTALSMIRAVLGSKERAKGTQQTALACTDSHGVTAFPPARAKANTPPCHASAAP